MPAKHSRGMSHGSQTKILIFILLTFKKFFDIFISLIKAIPGQTALYSNNKFREYVCNVVMNKKYSAIYTYTIRSSKIFH